MCLVLFISSPNQSLAKKPLPSYDFYNLDILEGARIGTISSFDIYVDSLQGVKTGYETQRKGIVQMRAMVDQEATDFALFRKNDHYFIFNLLLKKEEKLSHHNLRYYTMLQHVSIADSITKSHVFDLIAIASSTGDIRFFTSEPLTQKMVPRVDNVNGVLQQLTTLRGYYGESNSAFGLFVSTYHVTTEKAIEQIEVFRKAGKTQEAEFISNLVVEFGNLYFSALYNYSHHQIEKVPEVWRKAFDACRVLSSENDLNSKETTRVLALSVIAHIVHDLAIGLQQVNYDNNPVDRKAFLQFNKLLLHEKPAILESIAHSHGNEVKYALEQTIDDIGTFWFNQSFIYGRKKAMRLHKKNSKEHIEAQSLGLMNRTNLFIELFY